MAGSSEDILSDSYLSMKEEYDSLSKLLLDFLNIGTIDKAWVCKSGKSSKAMFSASHPNILANNNRKFILSASIHKPTSNSPVDFEWSPFPVEVTGASIILPSPSGSKLLIVRNSAEKSPTKFEIWDSSILEKEFLIPQSIHGSLYTDGWFEGVSWNNDETLIAYVAEKPTPLKPMFNNFGYDSAGTSTEGHNNWKGQGDWEEGWGETYVKRRCPATFVIDVNSGEVRAVEGIDNALSVGQVVWAPATNASQCHLIVVGWPEEPRKLGMKYCTNRPCTLYAVRCPFSKSEANTSDFCKSNGLYDSNAVKLTKEMSSAFYPHFSPDGRFLVFLSAKSALESGTHNATFSLHSVDWPCDGKPNSMLQIVDVVPVVMSAEDGCFPGLYFPNILKNPWLSDSRTIILSSIWRSTQVILSVDVVSRSLSCITPHDSSLSWEILSLDEDNVIAVCSGPINVPQIKYGRIQEQMPVATWNWEEVPSPLSSCSEEVSSRLSSLQFNIMRIPVRCISENCTEGARKPFETIFVSPIRESDICNPLIAVLHGGPHDVATSKFSKTLAFLASTGYNLLVVNYRGSLGFGEEALQSLPGNVGSQDVNDVLTAIDHVVGLKLAESPRIAVYGGSHGGFLSAHLVGQAPEKFSVGAVWNPVCNFALMVGTTDIPDWCFVNAYGSGCKGYITEAPSKDNLNVFYDISPISHVHKVKAPMLFLLGAQDRRVPVPDGLQYARALKEQGNEVKVIMFPDDIHEISRSIFSGKEDFGSTRPQKTSSFKGERGPQKWLRRQLSRQMSFKGPTEEAEYAAAVAAAAFAVTSLESDLPDQRNPDVGQPFSLPRIISGIVGRIASAAEQGEASERTADEHEVEAKEMIPERTIHPVPSIRRAPTKPKKRLSFADEFQEDSGMPFNYIENTPNFDEEEFENSKRMKPTNSFPRRNTSMKRTPSFGENQTPNTKLPREESLAPGQFPETPIPPPPAVPPLKLAPRPPSKRAQRSTRRRTEEDADEWEREEMAKIKERYEKLNATILEWEDKKMKKARRKLETTENELEKRRAKALQNYQNEMERIKQIADGARAQAKEKRRNEEFKVKDKANKYRATGEPPMPPLCRCL